MDQEGRSGIFAITGDAQQALFKPFTKTFIDSEAGCSVDLWGFHS